MARQGPTNRTNLFGLSPVAVVFATPDAVVWFLPLLLDIVFCYLFLYCRCLAPQTNVPNICYPHLPPPLAPVALLHRYTAEREVTSAILVLCPIPAPRIATQDTNRVVLSIVYQWSASLQRSPCYARVVHLLIHIVQSPFPVGLGRFLADASIGELSQRYTKAPKELSTRSTQVRNVFIDAQDPGARL